MLGLGLLRGRQLLDWSDNSVEVNVWYVVLSVALVLFAGCMSGLTLGLLQLDIVDLEVLRRSGNAQERRYAENIVPILKNAHYLLVTLLLCNAAAMEALPIFLDKMVQEVAAVAISVTAVLLFGEIIPQAVCSKHGLMIGSIMAMPVRFLMLLTAPISWPLSKLLDIVLGGDHASLFRRKQLKALVHIHSKDEGFGGKLTTDEIQVISGALDLSTKVAVHAMTPLCKAEMLSTLQVLDDSTVDALLDSKPYSRLPVYRGEDRTDIVGLVLVKELLQHVRRHPNALVSSLKIRPIPRMSAATPMYTLLKLFRSGKAHMAVLTQPPSGEPLTPGRHDGHAAVGTPEQGGYSYGAGQSPPSSVATPAASARGEGAALLGKGRGQQRGIGEAGARAACSSSQRSPARHAARKAGGGGALAAAYLSPLATPRAGSVTVGGTGVQECCLESCLASQQQHQGQQLPVSFHAGDDASGPHATPLSDPLLHPVCLSNRDHQQGTGHSYPRAHHHSRHSTTPIGVTGPNCGSGVGDPGVGGICSSSEERSPSSGGDSASSLAWHHARSNTCGGSVGLLVQGGGDAGCCQAVLGGGDTVDQREVEDEEMGEVQPLLPSAEGACSTGVLASRSRRQGGMWGASSRSGSGGLPQMASRSSMGLDGTRTNSLAPSSSSKVGMVPQRCDAEEEEEEEEEEGGVSMNYGVGGDALPGEALGIITIEDVIEELMQFEIVDETDVYVDNEQLLSVADAALDCDLPDTLKAVMSLAEAARARAFGAESMCLGKAAVAELKAGAAVAAAAAQAAAAAAVGMGMGVGKSGWGGGMAGALGSGVPGSGFVHTGPGAVGPADMQWQAMVQAATQAATHVSGSSSYALPAAAGVGSPDGLGPQCRTAGGKEASSAGLRTTALHPSGSSAIDRSGGSGGAPQDHMSRNLAAPSPSDRAAMGLLQRARDSLAFGLTKFKDNNPASGQQSYAAASLGMQREAELATLPPELAGAHGVERSRRSTGGPIGLSGGAVAGARRRAGAPGVGVLFGGRSGGGGLGGAGAESAPLLEISEHGGGEEDTPEAHSKRGGAGAWARLFPRRASSPSDMVNRASFDYKPAGSQQQQQPMRQQPNWRGQGTP